MTEQPGKEFLKWDQQDMLMDGEQSALNRKDKGEEEGVIESGVQF